MCNFFCSPKLYKQWETPIRNVHRTFNHVLFLLIGWIKTDRSKYTTVCCFNSQVFGGHMACFKGFCQKIAEHTECNQIQWSSNRLRVNQTIKTMLDSSGKIRNTFSNFLMFHISNSKGAISFQEIPILHSRKPKVKSCF